MVRISDILKKKLQPQGPCVNPQPANPEVKPPESEKPQKEDIPPQKEPQTSAVTLPETAAQPAVSPTEDTQEQPPQMMQIAKAMKEIQLDKAHSKNLYLFGTKLAEEVLNNAREIKPIDLAQIKDWVSQVVDYLILKDKELLILFYESSAKNYLYAHMVNACIGCMDVGLGMGYNKSNISELGLAAFLHDIGMVKVETFALLPRTLSEEEFDKIKEHPAYGVEILSRIKDIPEAVIYAAKEQHEHVDGKGYPAGLKDAVISEYARIIAVVDAYEALTHDRPHRKKFMPYEAIKEILTENISSFDIRILKVLINRIGIYPVGSWVELNTHEIGKVIAVNEEFPLRPAINLFFDNGGSRLEEPRIVNLAKQFNLFIKKPLSDSEVSNLIKE